MYMHLLVSYHVMYVSFSSIPIYTYIFVKRQIKLTIICMFAYTNINTLVYIIIYTTFVSFSK